MGLEYKEDFWQDAALKRQFLDLTTEIHNLSLAKWGELGYWDDAYRPFGFFLGDEMISSVCVYSLDMTVAGRAGKVAQISAVATRPIFRRQGLNSRLTNTAVDWAKPDHDFFYLFADKEAGPYYQGRGFRPVVERRARYTVEGAEPRPGARKLDLDNQADRDLIVALARQRSPVSDSIGILNHRLFMFWCLYVFQDDIYHVPDLDLIVACRREGDTLTLFDVVGRSVPDFATLYPHIAAPGDRAVDFKFMPDKMGLDRSRCTLIEEDNGLHLMGEFPLSEDELYFPITSRA